VFKNPRLVAGVCAALIFSGCSAADDVDATHLTIATTESSLDHAAALAVAEYVTDQGATVEIEQHDEPDNVFATLEEQSEPAPDHITVAVVTAHQDPEVEDHPLRVPDTLEVVAQAPAELALVPAASTVTTARFAQDQEEDAAQPLAPACQDQTWLHAHTPEHEVEATVDALADLGCEPTFESIDPTDAEAYEALAQRLTTEDDTVALLYGVDPMLVDHGFATLDVATEQWPHSNVVAVAEPELDDPLVDHIDAVLNALDSDSATSLLRGYHNAELSTSDLNYTVDHAIRYWLAEHDLIEQDTVSDISTDDE
jgi:hypothetical protein